MSTIPSAWVACLVATLLGGCGAARGTAPHRTGISGPPEIVGTIGRATVAIVPRATEGRTWVSLWIDAGSRDADPPQLATAAAWEATAGTDVRARVLPDGTELAIACSTSALDACMARLGSVLSRRDVAEDTLAPTLERLRATRRGARADESRLADRLAIAALLGDARGLDPLGEAADDARIDAATIRAFRGASWGPERALVVVVGDAPEDDVRDSIAAHLGSLPAATDARAERTIEPHVGGRVEIGDRAHASAAIAVRGAERGTAIARRVIDDVPEATASVFPLRGGEIVVARGEDVTAIAESVAHARAMVGEGDDRPMDLDDPDAIASRLGASWVARADAIPPEGGMGIGAIVAGVEGAVGDDPDRALRERAERDVAALAERVIAPGTGAIARDRIDGAIVLRSDDGARALARREGVGRVAIALAIEAPAALEPASAHGRRALLARLVARCASASGEAAPFVEDHAIGVVLEVQPRRAIEGIDALSRCARTPPFDAASFETERASMIAELGDVDRVMALAADAIAPGAPSTVALRGTVTTLAGLDARTVAARWRDLATRERVTLAIVGEVDEEVVARSALLGLRRLPRGAPATAAARPGIAREAVLAAQTPGEGIEVVVALRDVAPRPRGAAAGVRALAVEIARALTAGGLAPIAIDGGAGEGGAWIAVAVRGDEDAIATIPARIERARAVPIDSAIERATAHASEARALASASASALARRLATGRDGDAPDVEAAREAVRAVLAAEARIVVARPAAASWQR